MESIADANCEATNDSFSLYERYLRSFNVVGNFLNTNSQEPSEIAYSSSASGYESSNSLGELSSSALTKNKQVIGLEKGSVSNTSENISLTSLQEDSSAAMENSLLNYKSDIDVPVSCEDSKSNVVQPVFITCTMENSNNAVDSVPMFSDVSHSDIVFKLPITNHLSFNGTIKHVQKLQPIVDPLTALSSVGAVINANFDEKPDESNEICFEDSCSTINCNANVNSDDGSDITNDKSGDEAVRVNNTPESTRGSQYEESKSQKCNIPIIDTKSYCESTSKFNHERSSSSLETSFDSGVRSPDMFSDEENLFPEPKPFWNFLKEFEAFDKRKVKKTEEILQGVLPPPSVTVLKINVVEMLKRYYSFQISTTESEEVKLEKTEEQTVTPTKRVSFVNVPTEIQPSHELQQPSGHVVKCNVSQMQDNVKDISFPTENTKFNEFDVSVNNKSIELKMCSEVEAKETAWPDILKCRHHDVYYNSTTYSEKLEMLALRLAERYVGGETDTSVCVHSGGMQSPSSATKRKAIQLKMAQAKSPGRRLSHLARRRQTFCRASTISEKVQSMNSKMVLIDKNFFPHKKLINSSDRKSPRRRTPGKKTPAYRTPGKKTPAKTPKTKSGGSSRKKAMRRLLLDSDNITRSQPTRETLKRALFISPENRKTVPPAPCTSVPVQALKSRRALFGSPVNTAETKSLDGSQSDHFLKRKRDSFDDVTENRSKIAKSLSFGGDSIYSSQPVISRRASEVLNTKNSVDLNETHKKKLLWAVSEALRIHGWRMSSPGFREKASTLARLTRKLLTLPPHAAKLSAPKLSTSETMFKLARQYVFAIIQGRSIEDCFQEEQKKIANETSSKITGYISFNDYQQIKAKQTSTVTSFSQIKENTFSDSSISSIKQEQPRSGTKNVLQDKFLNADSSSNSSLGLSSLDKVGLYKTNSMPSFQEAAKMRARRQISFDNVDLPKR